MHRAGGFVPFSWDFDGEKFFLRDDRDAGIVDEERYSLFREDPYGRIAVYAGSLAWALVESYKKIKEICPWT